MLTSQANRQKLCSIIETIVLRGQQNIPLCGHRDSGTDVKGSQLDTSKNGNFQALLNFRISAGDIILKNTAGRNATLIYKIKSSTYLVIMFVTLHWTGFVVVFVIL